MGFFERFRKKLSEIEARKTTFLNTEPKRLSTDAIFRLTLSNVSDAVFITQPNGKFTFICPNVNVIFGYNYKEVKQFDSIDKILGDKLISYQELKEIGEISNIEHIISDKNGEKHIVLVNIKKVDIDKGKMLYTCRDITARKAFEKELEISQKKFRDLANKIESVREDEKKRISKEIHDEFGHVLTGLKLDLSFLKSNTANSDSLEKIESMKQVIDETINRVRDICTELRPSVLDHFGIIPAIEWHAEQFSNRTGLKYELLKNVEDAELDENKKIAVFRIFQEALTNIARHSKADFFEVIITYNEEFFELKIIDNGIGINSTDITDIKSLGILGMKERAYQVNGILEINGNNQGTEIKLRINLI